MEKNSLISENSNKNRIKKQYSQLWLSLWKHSLLQRRSLLQTLIELIVPAVFVIMLLPIRTLIITEERTNFTTYRPFGLNMLDLRLLFSNTKFNFSYYPNDSRLIDTIAKKVGIRLHLGYSGKLS